MSRYVDEFADRVDDTNLWRAINFLERYLTGLPAFIGCLFASGLAGSMWPFIPMAAVFVIVWSAAWIRHTVEGEAVETIATLEHRLLVEKAGTKAVIDEAVRMMKGSSHRWPKNRAADVEAARVLYRQAAKAAHPDRGGSREVWDQVEEAARKLGVSR